jgi:hypothetical protein
MDMLDELDIERQQRITAGRIVDFRLRAEATAANFRLPSKGARTSPDYS